MRLKLGGGIPTFKSEKIRLNSKLSVKIVRKQVYERTEASFACCGFFGSVLLYLLLLEGFSFLRPFLLCYLFDSYRVLYLFIRPLCRGYFWLSAEIPETGQLLNHFPLAPSCEGAVGSAD